MPILATLLLITSPLPVLAEAAAFQPGEGFQVGGVHFHVVSTSAETGALFRVAARLEADGLEEHSACYRVGRAFYHQEACSVLQAHFVRYGDRADSAQPAPETSRGSYGSGSHPIDYLRGSYVEPDRPYHLAYPGFYSSPWLGASGLRSPHRGWPGLRFHRGREHFGRGHFGRGHFGHGSAGARFHVRRW